MDLGLIRRRTLHLGESQNLGERQEADASSMILRMDHCPFGEGGSLGERQGGGAGATSPGVPEPHSQPPHDAFMLCSIKMLC